MDRDFSGSVSNFASETTKVTCGVSLGSFFGPLLFSIYMTPLTWIIINIYIIYHNNADNIQLYITMSPGHIYVLIKNSEEIYALIFQNFLNLN